MIEPNLIMQMAAMSTQSENEDNWEVERKKLGFGGPGCGLKARLI